MGKERLSRRGAILAGLTWGAGGVAAGIDAYLYRRPILAALRHLSESSPQMSEIPLAELENCIDVSSEGQWGRATRVNKSAFATALAMVALKMNPKEGFVKLVNKLSRDHLKITFAEDSAIVLTRQGPYPEAATYFWGGDRAGELMLRPNFMRDYAVGLLEQSASGIRVKDKELVHEFVHILQHVLDPNELRRQAAICATVEVIRSIPPLISFGHLESNFPRYDHESNPLEGQADQIAAEIVDPQLDGIENIEDFPWPFGRFFEFPG